MNRQTASYCGQAARRRRQRGLAVVETLVAILIFSIGILGIVALLANSIRNASEAKYRSQASMLANQVVGEMWVGDKSNASLKSAFASPSGTRFKDWKERVAASLPGVAANAPTIVINNDNVATVTVRWDAPGGSSARNFVLVARIRNKE